MNKKLDITQWLLWVVQKNYLIKKPYSYMMMHESDIYIYIFSPIYTKYSYKIYYNVYMPMAYVGLR